MENSIYEENSCRIANNLFGSAHNEYVLKLKPGRAKAYSWYNQSKQSHPKNIIQKIKEVNTNIASKVMLP